MKIGGIKNTIGVVPRSANKSKSACACLHPFVKNTNFPSVSFSGSVSLKSTSSVDTFQRNSEISYSDYIKNYFSKFKKYKISDYEQLSLQEREKLKGISQDKDLKQIVDESINMALLLKSYLDKKYGEDQYTFVSVGRSPSAIARVFEFMGKEVKYLPVSGLRILSEYKECRCAETGSKYYAKFLKRQGITKKDIEKSGKKYLFFDYTYTGTSLYLFEDILCNDFGLENCENIEFLSLNRELKTAADENKSYTPYPEITDNMRRKKLRELEDKYVQLRREIFFLNKRKLTPEDRLKIDVYLYEINNFYGSKVEKYSGMPALTLYKMKEIKKAGKTVSLLANQYNFLLMDRLKKMGLLQNNAKNKDCL